MGGCSITHYEDLADRADRWDVKTEGDEFVSVTVPSDNGTILHYLVRRAPIVRESTAKIRVVR